MRRPNGKNMRRPFLSDPARDNGSHGAAVERGRRSAADGSMGLGVDHATKATRTRCTLE